jgi:hypothetical protein
LSLINHVDTFINANGKILFDRKGTVYGPIAELFFFPKNLEQHDFVGVMEHMPQSLAILNRDLGTKIVDDGKINENPTTPAKRYGESKLARIFAEDIESFLRYEARLLKS